MRTRGFIVLGVAIVVCALLRSAIGPVSVDGAIKLALSMPAGEILAFRLQSVLSAAMLGAALGLSGLALQSLLRNLWGWLRHQMQKPRVVLVDFWPRNKFPAIGNTCHPNSTMKTPDAQTSQVTSYSMFEWLPCLSNKEVKHPTQAPCPPYANGTVDFDPAPNSAYSPVMSSPCSSKDRDQTSR